MYFKIVELLIKIVKYLRHLNCAYVLWHRSDVFGHFVKFVIVLFLFLLVLTAVNDDSPTVPGLLTDYILKGIVFPQ